MNRTWSFLLFAAIVADKNLSTAAHNVKIFGSAATHVHDSCGSGDPIFVRSVFSSPIAGGSPDDQPSPYGGAAYAGDRPTDHARQVTAGLDYALTLPDVKTVVPDTLGYRLTVTFASGWRTAIVPIEDGVAPDATPGLPPRR